MSVSPALGVHIRSPLARAVYAKMTEDQRDSDCNHEYWYYINTKVLPTNLSSRFVQFNEDSETRDFLDACRDKSDWLFTELLHSFIKFALSWVMHQTSINGFLQRGSMFVFSTSQFQQFLHIEPSWRAQRMIDLGAGDGKVTKQMADHFEEVYVTETSSTMMRRLAEKKYKVIGIDSWHGNETLRYDLVSCLNLLDRCSRPLTLLQQIRASLVPVTGRLFLAVVLPFNPYDEYSSSPNHAPAELLNIRGKTFEDQVVSLVNNVFTPAGFSVERLTRLPYLCEGDLQHSYYILYDAVFLLRASDPI